MEHTNMEGFMSPEMQQKFAPILKKFNDLANGGIRPKASFQQTLIEDEQKR